MAGKEKGDEIPFSWPHEVSDLGPLNPLKPLKLQKIHLERAFMRQHVTGVQITLNNGTQSPFFG